MVPFVGAACPTWHTDAVRGPSTPSCVRWWNEKDTLEEARGKVPSAPKAGPSRCRPTKIRRRFTRSTRRRSEGRVWGQDDPSRGQGGASVLRSARRPSPKRFRNFSPSPLNGRRSDPDPSAQGARSLAVWSRLARTDHAPHIALAARTNSALLTAKAPFGRRNPSSKPTLLDAPSRHASATHSQTLPPSPCNSTGKSHLARSRTANTPRASFKASSGLPLVISTSTRRHLPNGTSETNLMASWVFQSPASTPTPCIISKSITSGASPSFRLTEA